MMMIMMMMMMMMVVMMMMKARDLFCRFFCTAKIFRDSNIVQLCIYFASYHSYTKCQLMFCATLPYLST